MELGEEVFLFLTYSGSIAPDMKSHDFMSVCDTPFLRDIAHFALRQYDHFSDRAPARETAKAETLIK